ncbi:hypothetical protein QAD02_000055 [Eretmocerus hayati]|uniref:Uncharacterized protein n=1 Tax=Eretmocerus hayati TaxID=131215 RepID=A0ACC2NCH2_9HYME|nr:hypothetical protein QAD02_000055 [Eretmocerus hayati]
MSTSGKLMVLLVFSSLVLKSESSRVSSFSRQIQFQNGSELVAFTMQKNNLIYISCEGIKKILKDSQRQLSRHCDLKVVTHTQDKVTEVSSCPIDTAINQDTENEPLPTARVVKVSKNNVVMFWADLARGDQLINLKSINIYLPDCSQETDSVILWGQYFVEIRHVIEQLIVLTRPKTYEVIYDNRDTCLRACSLLYNDQGSRMITPLEANLTKITEKSGEFIFPARFGSDLLSPSSCFLLSSEEKLNVSMVFNKNVFNLMGFDLGVTRRPKISTAHGILTICHEVYNTKFLNCSRGNLNKWFSLTFDSKFQGSLVHNLPDGGFLTLTVVKREMERKSFLLRLSRFDVHGKLRNVNDVMDLKCGDGLLYCFYVDMYQNIDGEMCVSVFRKVETVDVLTEEQINWLKPKLKNLELAHACYKF